MSALLQEIRACAVGQAITDNDSRTMEFIFPPSFLGFQGHFPSQAILPGMVQIMAGIVTAENGHPLTLLKVGRAKFSRIIMPLETVQVTASTTAKNGHVQAIVQIAVHDDIAASLTLELIPTGDGQ